MKVRRPTTCAAFLLLAVVIYSGGVLPQQRHTEASEIVAPLRFGQSTALSDFDADGLVDEARLEGSSLRKSVAIRLSSNGKRSFLHFSAARPDYGSLLVEDVDNDGATDLVWTNLLHADDVIVWLGDGTGQFERTSAEAYRDRFTLGGSGVDAQASIDYESAINSPNNRLLAGC